MLHHYTTFLKPRLCQLILTTILFVAGFSARSQCWENFSVYQVSPYGALCSPQYVTLRAEYYDYNPYGEIRWYSSETDPFPLQTGYIDYFTTYNDYFVYATHGLTVWVSYYNYNTGCESYRQPYTFYISSPPNLFQDYGVKCNYDAAKVQLSSNTSGVMFQLYKYVEYYDPMYGWVQEYQLQQSNYTGYFEIFDFDPIDQYNYYAKVYQPYGCGTGWYYQLYFDIVGPGAPSVTGNLNILVGATTSLNASGNAFNFRWYDASGNLFHTGWQYTTPSTLTAGAYTYEVRGSNSDGTCLTDPTSVTVNVSNPNVIYTSPYNSSNFTKTIDLSKPVGTVSGTPNVTGGGGATYSIPIYSPPGTNDLKPSVNVTYSSQSGNGVVGYGWNIGGLSAVARIGKNIYHNGITAPVSYTNEDGFTLDGTRLNAISGTNGANGTTYATEAESFSTITSYAGSANNPGWFKIVTKEGITVEFGNTTDSRILAENGQNVMLWRMNKIIDIKGNYILFKYDNGFRDSRIDEIKYTGNDNAGLAPYNTIKFNYETREDRSTRYEGGGSIASRHLLKSITVTSEGNPVKTYQFNYAFDNITSLLKEVIELGTDGSALNSTIFLYGDQPQNLFTQSTIALQGSYDFFSGDFDADGVSDLLAAETYFDPNMNTRLHSNYSLVKDVSESSYTLMYNRTLPQNVGSTVIQDKKFFNFLTADYDGDGRDDVMEIYSTSENMHCQGYKRNVSGGMITYTKSFNNQTGWTDYTQESFSFPTDFIGNQYRYVSDKGIFYLPGDFDGDGNQDFIFVLGKKRQISTCLIWPRYEYDFKAFMSSPSTDEMNKEITGFGFGANPNPDFYAGTVANADFINTLDFDGDGKLEILVTKDFQSHVIRVQRVSATTGFYFGATAIFSTGEITKDSKVYPGDFNGDRKTDFLVRNSNGSWKILYGTGAGFISASFTFNQTVDVTSSDPHKIIISDFNGDGQSDILHGYEQSGNSSRFSLYYYRGQNSTSPFFYEQYTYNNPLAFDNLTVGDFNGDGRSDLLNRWYVQTAADFISFKQFGKERLLVKVTDGHNSTTEFQYKRLTDKDNWPYFYNRTVSLDDPSNLNPFNYVEFPMYAVSALVTPNGIGGTNTTSYNYENAVVHRHAKGFLGFKKVVAKNAAAGTTTITENEINTQFAAPYSVKQTTTLTSSGQVLAETFNTLTFTNLSTGFLDKRYHQKLDKVLKLDHLKGFATEETNTYDNYGNIASHVMKVGSPSGNTVNAIETTTTATTYGIHNTPVPAKPDQVTKTMSRSGAAVQNIITQYWYNGTGLVTSETEYYGQPKAVTTTYSSFDALGNPGVITVSATGINSHQTHLTYDSKGRFVQTRILAAGTGIAQTETTVYDGKWGKALSQTTSDCLTSTYEYDAFGRPKKTIGPVFTANYSLVWDVQGNNIFYSFSDFTGGQPDLKTWFDRLGRETVKQVAGYNNQWLTNVTTYDSKGNVSTSTNSYYSSETPVTTTHTYDAYNRPATVSNALKTITYSYSQPAAGQVTATATEQTGQSTGKTIDATGKVVAANDKGGNMYYTYNSYGSQTEVKHGSTVLITNTYDIYGRQTGLSDKNAGAITYEYDALGRLVSQTDNSGHTYQMVYDVLGRMVSRQGPEGTTTYEYFKDNTTGCSNNNVKKITGFNGVIKEYLFDNLRRMQTEQVTIDGVAYITTYGYDSWGRMNKITYPSGIEVNKVFDNNGNLQTVTGGNPGVQTTLFTATQMNGFGRYTSYTLGNNKTSQVTYQYGVPTRYFATGVQDLNLTWDFARGNLQSRQDVIKGITETFQYDDLNRLTQSSVNSVLQNTVNYDGNSRFSMGNIVAKADAGNYAYRNDRIHAVAYITNPAGNTAPPVSTSQTEQIISYTPFLKPATITENPYLVSFTYGPDYQRVKTVMQTNSVVSETKIFLGNYEKQTDNAGTREIHYVQGGDGLCAIIVKQNGTNNFYVTYGDHLGSILTLTDLGGNVVTEQNFDAWGRKRNPQNWTYNAVPAVPSWLYRGYTGHEHLPQFALINMNGRLYDPVQARMLSPDNYVPNPFGTQGYNRYTYALNNPLTYVDPDGNNPLIFIAVFAGVFAVGNTVVHAINGDIDNFWDGLRYFAQGAIAGAILGTGVGFGLTVPVLAPAIKLTGLIYGGLTALNFASAAIQSIVTGDITPLANAGRLFLGNFYLDENKSFFGGVLEGVSRFTWQSTQQLFGYATASAVAITWGVRSVTFYGGATAVETNDANWGGITQGSFIVGDRGLQANPNNPLFQHEYGHYIQSQIFGPWYYRKIGIPSFFSKRSAPHEFHPAEQDANARALAYFNRHVPGYTGWNNVANPILNPNFRLGIHWFDFIDPLGIINAIVLNRQY